ncbi:hypothetical protein CPC08DRAFT_707966 [Agrocybe pediades]|nr:hypothetical protein CPC08DRAFT_707966 [Agrocybe pediades]
MRPIHLAALVILAHTAAAHYIFDTLIYGSKVSTKCIRKPAENAPVHKFNETEITCNIDTSNATQTLSIPAGRKVTFKLGENKTIYHPGPVSIYMGKAPHKAIDWDGSGKQWFKIAEWGATFNPFKFISMDKSAFNVTIPKQVPSGEYLLRIEHIALHNPGYPEFFVSCAQVKITGGGKGKPTKVSIPGYVSEKDPGLMMDIYWPVPTSYTVPGPPVYKGDNVDKKDQFPTFVDSSHPDRY